MEKTLSLILLIGIGVLLKSKISHREELAGIKLLILSVALPATIFLALLKVEIEPSLLALPALALLFNLIMLIAARYLLPLLGVDYQSAEFRTYWLLIPSLAPGLSSFPFLAEYLGEEALAHAALADVGNKIFVLILLYLLAMHLFYRINRSVVQSRQHQLRGLALSLIQEPVNLVLIAGLLMLSFGLHLDALPAFLQDAIQKMGALMTPAVLLFIGMAVRFNRKQFSQIFRILLFRSGLAFLLSAIFISLAPELAPVTALLAIVFPQSAISFWPFSHMSAVAKLDPEGRVFNLELALNLLALSLPFSTIVALGICTVGPVFAQPLVLWLLGGVLVIVSFLPSLLARRRQEPATELSIPAPVEVEVD